MRGSERFVVGTIKGLDCIYGIDLLLEACALIKKERPEINFVVKIAGKGKDEKMLSELAESLGLEKTVVWLGFIPQERVAYEWANMDVAIIPSRQESFGVASIEAQACSTPVIISDVNGLMETTYVQPNFNVFHNGDYIGLKEAILRVHDNIDLAKTIAARGKDAVLERFEINHCFENIENLMKKYFVNPK